MMLARLVILAFVSVRRCFLDKPRYMLWCDRPVVYYGRRVPDTRLSPSLGVISFF